MTEDLVLLETKMQYPSKEVFKLQFSVGEFDMVVFDPHTLSAEVYEIKHSNQIHPNQCRFLLDEELINKTKFRYGDITKRCVIYSGETCIVGDIQYINVEEYLLFK